MKRTMRFQKIGGSRQLVLEKAEELEQILNLDQALWAVTAMPIDAVITDKEFLTFLDTDSNGRIRADELLCAVSWLLGVLKDYSGIDNASDTLRLSALNPDHKDTAVLLSSARLVLANLGAEDTTQINLAQARDKKSIIAAGNSNGDGIITPDNTDSPETAKYIKEIIVCCGSKTDLSGDPGIDEGILNDFIKEGTAHLEWLKVGRDDDNNSPYGGKVADFYSLYATIRVKINEFFTFCGGLTDEDMSRFSATQKTDPLNVDEMDKFINTAPVAMPSISGILSTGKWINPLWKSKILDFLALAKELNVAEDQNFLTESEWRTIEKSFVVRSAWNARKTNDKFDILDIETLENYLSEEKINTLKQMIATDISVAKEIAACDLLKKLILYQRHMLDFVNNFICLERLFDPRKLSIIQPGELIMDGRRFTLMSNVTNLAEHKKIIMRSNICVMYLELNTGTPATAKKMTLAAAITSGSMRNIFVGKTGIFKTGDGIEWDAKVIDLIQQPVSFSEALQMPFYRFGEFAGKQADRFFSAKSKNMETDITKQVTEAANTPPPSAQAKPQQTPAVSGSMMLMGGGVGLAALGSSFAFIAHSLKSVSVWNVVAVFIGIILIISAPVLLVSLVKLWTRCISDFFAAGGWAINPKMRLSRRMGLLFTHKPNFPKSILLKEDLVKVFSKRFLPSSNYLRNTVVVLLVLFLSAAAGYWLYTKTHSFFGF